MQAVQQNLRLQKIVTAIGIVLFITKLVAWSLTKSVAILTDTLESTVNVVAGLVGVYSLYVSAKPKDRDHPYGHGKAEFISAAMEGTLVTVAGLFIIYKSFLSLLHPQLIQKLDFGILLVAITAIVNYVAGTICVQTGRKNKSPALMATGKHLQSDTYSTAGIVVGLILLYFLKWSWLDSAVAILFACIIMFMGYKIVRKSIAGIMDEADTSLLEKMVAMLNSNRRNNWIDLHNLRIIKYGGTIHLDCHLTVPWYLNVYEAHSEVESLSELVRNEFGETMELFVHSDPCVSFSCRICMKEECNVRQHPFIKKIEWTMENISTDHKHQL